MLEDDLRNRKIHAILTSGGSLLRTDAIDILRGGDTTRKKSLPVQLAFEACLIAVYEDDGSILVVKDRWRPGGRYAAELWEVELTIAMYLGRVNSQLRKG